MDILMENYSNIFPIMAIFPNKINYQLQNSVYYGFIQICFFDFSVVVSMTLFLFPHLGALMKGCTHIYEPTCRIICC